MAKKKKKRKSSSSARKRGGAGAGWKKSPIIAGILVFFILVVWVRIFCGGSSQDQIQELMQQMPYTYMSEDGTKIVKVGPQWENKVPFEEDGKMFWQAFACRNPDCPGKEGDKPYVFAHILPKMTEEQIEAMGGFPEGEDPPEYDREIEPLCPACYDAGVEYGEMPAERYMNEEAKKLYKRIMELAMEQ